MIGKHLNTVNKFLFACEKISLASQEPRQRENVCQRTVIKCLWYFIFKIIFILKLNRRERVLIKYKSRVKVVANKN